MIRSMTGFGAAFGTVGNANVNVEIRAVNHRFFSPSIKLPGTFVAWEPEVRETIRQRVNRGHVTVTARIDRTRSDALAIDETRFAEVVEQLRALQSRHNLDNSVDMATILRMPDVIGAPREEEVGGTVSELIAVVDDALDGLNRMREAEGGRLAAILTERLAIVSEALERIALRAPSAVNAHRDRLRQAVLELTDGIGVDEARLAQEVALLADRLDVSEEIDRFRSHIHAFRETLGDGSDEGQTLFDETAGAASGAGGLPAGGLEPVGKRLGFLLQEMLREANTTGSKGGETAILHDVVLIKEELERIREQVENLE